MYIENLVELKIKKAFALQESLQLRKRENETMRVKYLTDMELTLSCSMRFKLFPFDEQYCDLTMYEVHLPPSERFNMTDKALKLGRFSNFSPTVRDYKYTLNPLLEASFIVDDRKLGKRNVATVGFRLTLSRDSSKYFVMYYIPTGQ